MNIGAGLSTLPDAADAAREAADRVPRRADLAFVFLSPPHLDDVEAAVAAVESELEPRHLVGCVAEGVVAREREVEEGPAVAVWSASLPGASVQTFHARAVEMDDGVAIVGFPELASPVILLADPYTFPTGPFLERLAEERPGMSVIGGLAVGGEGPGRQALIAEGGIHREGAVGAALAGVTVVPLVSQGCAPIGRDAVITRAEENVVYELAGEPALERLRSEIGLLDEGGRALAAGGVLAGLVIDENRAEYGRGDYLMRAILGADEEDGALVIGERVRVGQTLRFHVRDAGSADDDLRETVGGALPGLRAEGALLFTCNGRGTSMFPVPDHDAAVVADAVPGDAVAGLFCGGEIGPVGGRSFLHGFTATVALFVPNA